MRTVKERIKGFYNNIPARVHKLTNMTLFLELFAFWYNHPRRHEGSFLTKSSNLLML